MFPSKTLILKSLPLSIALSATSSVFADASQQETMVVTATRTAQTANDTVSSIRVIDREEIERSQSPSLTDLLRKISGLHIVQNGGRGQNSSVFMRGTNSNHLIVLVDGVKIGSATSGSTAFQDLPIELIDRIEVVKGPRSSLYGSEAIGGVIQVFTKKGGESVTSASTTVGSNDTYEASITTSGSIAGFNYGFGISGDKTGGINACREEASTEFGGCWTDEPDHDGNQSVGLNANVSYEFDNGYSVALQALQSDGETEFDGNSQNEGESLQRVVSVKSVLPITSSYIATLSASRSLDESDNFKNGIYSSTFNTERDTASLLNEFMVNDNHTIVVGVDYQKDKIHTNGDNNFDSIIDASDQYDDTARENWGSFAQLLSEYGKHSFEGSFRLDDNEQFGSKKTGSFGYGYRISDSLMFFGSYGTAFAAPTFNQLYYPNFGVPDLEPEKSKTIEAGLRAETNGGLLSLSVFKTKVKDLIAYDSATFSTGNIDQASITGIELELEQSITDQLSLILDFAAVNAVNDSNGASNGNKLARRPNRSGNVTVNYDEVSWSLGADLRFASSHYDDKANNKPLDAYQVLDLRAQYTLCENITIQGKVENVLREEYETAKYYNERDRSYYLTAKYSF